MYNDMYVIKQWDKDRRAELTQSYQNGKEIDEQVRILTGQALTWLGNRFTGWGQKLQSNKQYGYYIRTGA